MTEGLGGNAGPFRFSRTLVDRGKTQRNAPPMNPALSTWLLAAAGCAAVGCSPYARPIADPYRASMGAFYMTAPRPDATPAFRGDVALDRWIDDRILLGVDAEFGSFSRTRGTTETLLGAGIRAAYVIDLAELQPRFGVRAGAERWSHGDGTGSSVPLVVVPFAAFDWAPRAWPFVVGAEVHSAPVASIGSSSALPAAAFGVRTAYVF